MIVHSVATNAVLDKDFSINLPYGRKSFLYVLFRSDTMVYTDGEFVFARKGSGILYDKNKIQSYYCCDEVEFNHDFLFFDTETAYESLIIDSIPKGKLFSHTLPSELSKALSNIESEMVNTSKYRLEILSNNTINFIYKLLDDINFTIENDNIRGYYEALNKLRKQIYKAPNLKYSVEAAANGLYLSRHYFMHIYKDFFGVAFAQDIINARIEMAKSLLITTNMKIFEIAEKCGYESTEHFIRQFSKNIGSTPHKFRNREL